MPIAHPFSNLWRLIAQEDWQAGGFERQKAYICALCAELTYFQVPEFERESINRFNVIPCFRYHDFFRDRNFPDFDEVVRSIDLGEGRIFVVIRRYAITVAVCTPKVVIIAIRGTQFTSINDWGVNLRATRAIHQGRVGSVHFHKGFFRAVTASLEKISSELMSFLKTTQAPPIYLTGHSLGGAMAAIMNAIWGLNISAEYTQNGIGTHRIIANDCYTFGMPRYGDMAAVSSYRNPYHIYNEIDSVPGLPPKWLGYENPISEFKIDGTCLENHTTRNTIHYAKWVLNFISGRGIKGHSIEGYRQGLE